MYGVLFFVTDEFLICWDKIFLREKDTTLSFDYGLGMRTRSGANHVSLALTPTDLLGRRKRARSEQVAIAEGISGLEGERSKHIQ